MKQEDMQFEELLLTFRQAVASNDEETIGMIGTLTYIDDLDELAQSADETISGHAIEIRNILHSANPEHSFIGDELTDFCYKLYVKLVKDLFAVPPTVTTLVHLNIESNQPLTDYHIERICNAVAYLLDESDAELVSVTCPLYEEI